MSFRFSTGKRRTSEEQDLIRRKHSEGISRVLAILGLIFLALEAFSAVMLVLPAWLELQGLRHDRGYAKQMLLKAQDEEDEARSRFIWMTDPEYFEQISRDRANLAKPGETVIRRPRSNQPALRHRNVPESSVAPNR